MIEVPLNVPLEHELGTWFTPSNETVTTEVTLNPVPVTVNVLPAAPLVALRAIAGFVTVNVAVAVLPPTSVALTVVPEVPLGTASPQVKVPVPPVVSDPLTQAVIVTESKTSDLSGVETEKPVPDTVTAAPNGPFFGVTVRAGFVTVKVPDAVPPPEFVAVTAVPVAPLGTAKVQLNAPAPFAVSEPLVQLVIVFESNTSDFTFVDGVKSVPDTVTVEPIGPWTGLTVIPKIATTVRLNDAVAWPPFESVTVSTTVNGLPELDEGVQLKEGAILLHPGGSAVHA